jgi:hypothetical protein
MQIRAAELTADNLGRTVRINPGTHCRKARLAVEGKHGARSRARNLVSVGIRYESSL